ncbi:predicted protein, partial [Nematostella vectensis]
KLESRYETNKNDPHSVRCRIFIGNLATDKIARQDLEEIFSRHGKVLGCSLHANFGFVQFETEKGADEAVAKEHGRIINGKKIGMLLLMLFNYLNNLT